MQKKNESPVQPGHIDSPHVLPGKKGIWFTPGVMVGIVILVLGGLLWTAYNITCKLYEEELDAHSREAAGMIAFHLENDCKYLLLLAEEKSRGKLDEKLFRERASLYVSDHPGLINITWADENFVIQWTAPYESNKQVVGLKLVLPEPALASRKAYETGKPFYTRPFEVIQGGAAFEVYVPVFQGDRFLGTFGGIYSIENVLLHHLPPYLRKQYRIDFLGNTGEAVCGLPPLAAIDRGLVRQVLLDPPGNGVSILLSRYEWHVWPTWVWLLIILSIGLAIGVGWGMIALRRDIDTRKRYELQLKEVNEQLRAGIDNMPNAYILVDTEYRVKEWNRKAEEIFGYTREEMMGKDPIDYIVPEEMRQCIRDPFKKHNPGNPVSYPGKNNNIRKDGTLITCLWSDTPMIDRSGSIYGILSMAQDITVQKESEEKIRRQHEFLHTTIDSLTHPFYVINADDFTVEMANLAAGSERIREAAGSGRIREKVTCYSLTHNRNTPCDLPQYICPVVEIKKTKKPYKTEHVHYDGNGNEFYSEIHGYPIFDKNGNVEKVIEYSLDITERKRMEEEKRRLADQLRHAQKMEAIGTLAGGVAHEFNNILGAIIGYTELSVDEAPENTTIRQNLEQVLIASDRAREMIRQILAFSRKDEIQRKPVLLGEIVSETLVLLKSTLPSFITIHSTIDENLKPIMANPTEIYQVLMNLCTNAAHAMKEKGGTLEISLGEIDADALPIDIKEPKHGRYQELVIDDTGCGMSIQVLNRVFEPYFTTKGLGEGTGMGLAVVHGIVTRHGGEIIARSELGKGSTFQVFLPVTESDSQPPQEEIKPVMGGNERILFIDDEALLTEMGKQLLEKLGYRVDTFTESPRALKAFRYSPEEFDLIITDQAMPGITGLQFAREVRKIRPHIPIVLCTGFSESVDEGNFKVKGVDAYIMKPIVKREIARVIREVLDSKINEIE